MSLLPYTYTDGYMSSRDSANVGDINKLITGALFEEVFIGFKANDEALILKDGGVWAGTLSSENGALSLTYGSITLANGTINAKIDGGTF